MKMDATNKQIENYNLLTYSKYYIAISLRTY